MTASMSLQGIGPSLGKELREWWQRRTAAVTFAVVAALGSLGTLATRIDEAAGGVPSAGMLDPTANVLGARFEQWIIFAAIFSSIGLLTQERATGTLAWSLSLPVSRTSILLAKWLGGTIMLTAFGVALPLIVSSVVAAVAYGATPELGPILGLALVLSALSALLVALDLALATRLDSQGAIAAIALGVAAAPYLLASILPALAEVWPTAITTAAGALAEGSAPSLPTVTGWAAGLLLVGLLGLVVFDREEL